MPQGSDPDPLSSPFSLWSKYLTMYCPWPNVSLRAPTWTSPELQTHVSDSHSSCLYHHLPPDPSHCLCDNLLTSLSVSIIVPENPFSTQQPRWSFQNMSGPGSPVFPCSNNAKVKPRPSSPLPMSPKAPESREVWWEMRASLTVRSPAWDQGVVPSPALVLEMSVRGNRVLSGTVSPSRMNHNSLQ